MNPLKPKIRLAVVSPFLDKRHGSERIITEWLSNLPGEFEIHVYSQHVEDLDRSRFTLHRIPKLPGPHLFNFLWWLAANRFRRYWDQRVRGLRYDLVFSSGTNCLDADAICVHIVFAEYLRQVATSMQFGKNSLWEWPRLLHRKIYYGVALAMERRTYRNDQTSLVACSHKSAEELKKYYAREERIPVLHLGLDHGIFNTAARSALRESARKELQLPPEQFTLILVGNDWRNKGVPALLAALAELRDLEIGLLIVTREDSPSCRQLIAEKKLSDRVVLLPPRKDIEFYYAAADAYAGPSLQDSYGIPPAEAMACGLPVIVSTAAGVSEIVTNGEDGMILDDPTNIAKLAAIIRRLYENKEFCKQLGKKASETARRYTWESNGRDLAAILRRNLSKKVRLCGADANAGIMTEHMRAKRKVLVLAPSLKSVGGVQNYTRTLIDALQVVLGKKLVRVIAVSSDPVVKDNQNLALPGPVKLRFFLSALATAIAWSPDLMICAHVGLAPAARLIQKIRRVPYWVVLYGIEVWGDLSTSKRNALRAAQRQVAITRFTLDATIARHGIEGNGELILPPTLPKARRSSPQPDRLAPNGAMSPIVLTVGRMAASERYKGHDIMLEAWPSVLRRVPNAVYWIVGGGDDRQRLESRAHDLCIAESVHFAGPVSDDELDVWYDRCCVFAMPARTELNANVPRGEGFGIVFLEAMAHGKPVVGPAIGAPAEFIRSGEHGLLVDPAESSEVAVALIELLEDPARARRMGNAGREWVLHEFVFDRFCERLRDALQE
jgi:phosphatidylinositol alpha-1,6-mannosyltransferase